MDKLQNKTQWFNQIYNSSHVGILIVDKNRIIVDVNPCLCSLLGYKRDELINKPTQVVHCTLESSEEFAENAFRAVFHGKSIRLDYQFKHKNGTFIWCNISGDLIKNTEEIAWTILDISKRIELKQKLQAKSKLLLATQTLLHSGTWEIDLQTNSVIASDEFYNIMGLKIGEKITLKKYLQCLHPNDRKIIFDSMKNLLKGEKAGETNLRVIHKKGKYYEMHYIFQKGEAIFDESGKAIKLAGATLDVTKQKENEILLKSQKKLLEYRAFHDSLTGLPNRALLLDRLEQMIQVAQRKNQKIAILFIDIDDFKTINDSLGHDIGDMYLIEIAKKIKKNIRACDTIARLGGDEFIILLDDIKSENDVVKIINEEIDLKGETLTISSEHIFPQMSVGIAMYPHDGKDVHTLLKNADAAMYNAKKNQKYTYSFYDSSLTQKAYNRINFPNELKQAMENNELLLYYQPQMNAKTNKLIGVEALVRWQHPTRGFLTPIEFLPLAEELGLMMDINRWVMKNAFKQLELWQIEGANHGVVSINMSAKQLECNECYSFIENLLKNAHTQAKWIVFELTEEQFIQNPRQAIKRLERLCNLGFQIVIDDFGTGYSSLSYLSKLPISGLKIDKSFVDNIPQSKDDVAITKTIIELAKNLNLDIIAEGVEKEEQKEFLLKNGCDNIQGYLYSKPLSVEDVQKFMSKF